MEKWKSLVMAWDVRDLRCGWRQARARSKEKAAEQWAVQEVCGTVKAMQVRKLCESFGVALMQAGGTYFMSLEEVMHHRRDNAYQSFDGLLANSTIIARVGENDDHRMDEIEEDVMPELLYEDEPCFGARGLRRAEHGAPRHTKKEKAWIEGIRIETRKLAHPRRQKRSVAVPARHDAPVARQLRRSRQKSVRRTSSRDEH
jgi:hypothetical protein